jgi:hypothetical protein
MYVSFTLIYFNGHFLKSLTEPLRRYIFFNVLKVPCNLKYAIYVTVYGIGCTAVVVYLTTLFQQLRLYSVDF